MNCESSPGKLEKEKWIRVGYAVVGAVVVNPPSEFGNNGNKGKQCGLWEQVGP